MLNVISRKSLFLFLFFFSILSVADAQEKVDMADVMRSNGKIYVVVTVLTIILIGLFIFLISIDRKITRLEKDKTKQ
jgi:hypothetical protein